MSGHIIYLWDAFNHGQPSSFEQAVITFQTLDKLAERPSSAMLAFAQRMQNIARWDLATSPALKNNQEFNDCFFNCVENTFKHNKALMLFHIPESNNVEIMQLIVKTANSLQLVALDDRYGMVFLPSGKIFPTEKAKLWQETLAFLKAEKELPQDIDAFVKWITPYVDQILSKNGFNRSHEITVEEGLELEKGGNVYTREIGIGYQHIGFVYIKNIREENRAYEIHISIDTEVPKINKIYGKFNFLNAFMDNFSISGVDLVNDGEFPAGHSKKYRNRIGFSAMYDKKAIFERLAFYEKLLFPFADTITDLQGLDDFVNGELNQNFREQRYLDGVRTPYSIILARLSNNPNFEALATQLANPKVLGANREVYSTEWPKLVKYLREDINPETCWQQFDQLEKEEQRLEETRLQALQLQFNPQTSEELMSLASQFYDVRANLIWQRCCVGQQWLNRQVTGNAQLLSWDEVKKIIAEAKHDGWRLPTKTELQSLIFTSRIGYITKEGYDFYERKEYFVINHWISPLDDICIMSVNNVENPTIYDAPTFEAAKNNKNLKGVLRLVKSVL